MIAWRSRVKGTLQRNCVIAMEPHDLPNSQPRWGGGCSGCRMHAVETLEDVTQTCTCREPRLSRFCRNRFHHDLTVKLPRISIYPFLEVIQNRAASSSVTTPGNTGRRTSGTALIKHHCGIARDKSDTWQCNFALERDSSVDSKNAQPFHFLF